MKPIDIIIIAIVLIVVFLAIKSIRKNTKEGGCAGCSSCGGGCEHESDNPRSNLSPLNQNKNTTHNTQK